MSKSGLEVRGPTKRCHGLAGFVSDLSYLLCVRKTNLLRDFRMTIDDIAAAILALDQGIVFDRNWGERALFYNPGNQLKKGIYIATFKERDGPHDKASHLNHGNRFRLNVGLPKSTYFSLFGPPPFRPSAGNVVTTGHDFAQCDVLMPHPVYGWMSWVGVINPSRSTFEMLLPHLMETIELARQKFKKRTNNTKSSVK
jgi:Family of unknown function (DUF6194)